MKRRIRMMVAALCLLSVSIVVYGGEEYFIVKDIHVQGLQRVSISTVLFSMPVRVGDIMNNKNLGNAIRSLFSIGKFDDVKVLRDDNVLIVKVKERPILANIDYIGNKRITEEILNKHLSDQGIKVGEFIDRQEIFNLEKTLENFYKNDGQYSATIQAIITPIPHNRVTLKLVFKEGVTVKIQNINIIGNLAFTKEELHSLFKLSDHVPWWNVISNRKYRTSTLVYDIETLRSFYLNRGYACFKIDLINILVMQDKNRISITLHITEGDKYTFLGTVVQGKKFCSINETAKLTEIPYGEPYRIDRITNMENMIKKEMNRYGYAYTSIIAYQDINKQDKTVKLYIHVNTGPRFYVRHVGFDGNEMTKDSVLRRETQQMERAWLDKDLVDQGTLRLNRIGYFEIVYTEIHRVSGTLDQVDVIYKVKERESGSMNVGVNFGTESGVGLQFFIQQPNWLGTGNKVNFIVNKNNYQKYAELSMINPYITLNGVSLSGKFFFSDFTMDPKNVSSYELRSYGFSSNFGLPANDKDALIWGIDYVHLDLSNIQTQVIMSHYLKQNGISLKEMIHKTKSNGYSEISIDDIFLTLGWSCNDLDQMYFPTSGSLINFMGKITFPLSDNAFYKLVLDASHYIPISTNSNWMLMGHLSAGYAQGLGKNISPFYDHFYDGASSTVRGFRSNTICPKSVYYRYHHVNKKDSSSSMYCNPFFIEYDHNHVAGDAIAILNLELIIPIFHPKSVRTSLFLDVGKIWDRFSTHRTAAVSSFINDEGVRISSGMALQWISPVGPLVFSYARPIQKCIGDKIEPFQFYVGKRW